MTTQKHQYSLLHTFCACFMNEISEMTIDKHKHKETETLSYCGL